MASDLGRLWRTLSRGKLFSKGKPNGSQGVPDGQPPQAKARQDTEVLGPVLKEFIARQEKLLQEQTQRRDTAGVASLSRELLEDAERQAASLRARAIRDSEVQAARIVAEAKQQAQEILSDARRDAQEASRAEVENIIASARKKAEIAEERSMQIAQLFLIKAREDVHDVVSGEAKEGYYRLLAVLQDIIAASHAIEKDWKDRSVQLSESTVLGWKDYHRALAASFGQAQLAAPEYTSGVSSPPLVEEAYQVSPPTSEVKVAPPLEPEPVAVTMPDQVAEEQVQATSTTGAEASPSQDEAAALGPSAMTEEEATSAASSMPETLSGEVEILVAPFSDVERLAGLYSHLQTVAGVRVLHSTGSWDKGTVVTVVLDQPKGVSDLLPSDLGAKVTLGKGKAASEDGGGSLSRITLAFPDA